jgi:hypothetical protein
MFGLGGKLTLVGDDQRGLTVKNSSSVGLRDIGILRRTSSGRTEAAYLAKLDAQTSAPLTFSPLAAGPIWLPQWSGSPIFAQAGANAAEEKGQVRLTRLARLAVERLRLAPGEVRLVAWTDDPLSGLAISPHAPQNATHTLVLAHLARGELPKANPDANVAEDYYEPEIEPDPSVPEPTETTSGS